MTTTTEEPRSVADGVADLSIRSQALIDATITTIAVRRRIIPAP